MFLFFAGQSIQLLLEYPISYFPKKRKGKERQVHEAEAEIVDLNMAEIFAVIFLFQPSEAKLWPSISL